jgi:hypothetical protein
LLLGKVERKPWQIAKDPWGRRQIVGSDVRTLSRDIGAGPATMDGASAKTGIFRRPGDPRGTHSFASHPCGWFAIYREFLQRRWDRFNSFEPGDIRQPMSLTRDLSLRLTKTKLAFIYIAVKFGAVDFFGIAGKTVANGTQSLPRFRILAEMRKSPLQGAYFVHGCFKMIQS